MQALFRHGGGVSWALTAIAAVLALGIIIADLRGPERRSHEEQAQQISRIAGLNLRGEPVDLPVGVSRPTLAMFFCQCNDCQKLAHALRGRGASGLLAPYDLVGVISATPAVASAFARDTSFPGTLLADPSAEEHQRFGVHQCPVGWYVWAGRRTHVSESDPLTLDLLLDWLTLRRGV